MLAAVGLDPKNVFVDQVSNKRFCTNDRFTTRRIDGEDWLLYLCRADDLLVHTSGEMSNPLPTEQQLIAECPSLLLATCTQLRSIVGNGLMRPRRLPPKLQWQARQCGP